jgi:hypothetical protein
MPENKKGKHWFRIYNCHNQKYGVPFKATWEDAAKMVEPEEKKFFLLEEMDRRDDHECK